MERRTVLGRIWDRQQDHPTDGADTPVASVDGPNVHTVRNATDARGESVSSSETRSRGESVRDGVQTRRRGESTG